VGLLRTEFLFQDRTRPPSVADQSAAYRAVLDAFAGVPGAHVVARVLDVGADKPLPFLPLGGEPNPALGMRGLRALRAHEHLLDDQLAALAAAADGAPAELWVMAPMVTDAEDAGYFADRAAAFGLRPAGVMIEVPSAALTADAVLARCAFASIGTNDLTQYTLAADRTLGALASRQNPAHPAVLALVAAVAAAGARAGKPVGVCGEAAADPDLAAILVGLGVSSLSMSAGALAGVRARLAVTSEQECRRLAEAALARD
jgi:phosphotransferase system enzyme I (PtsI)